MFADNLKTGDIAGVMLMYGVEQYLVSWAVGSLVSKYVNPGTLQMDYQVLEEDVTAGDILSSCNTFSMFSEKRVVWVKNFQALTRENAKGLGIREMESLIEYVKDANPSTLLIFSSEEINEKVAFVKQLKSLARVYDFCPLEEGQLIAFAKKRFAAAGVNIKDSVLRMMVDLSGYKNRESDYHIYNLVNDIEKAVAHSNGSEVREEDISFSINGDMDTYMFDFIDAVSTNHKEKAFTIMHNMLTSGAAVFSIIGMIASQIELMVQVKELRESPMNLMEISKKLKIHEFRVKKAAAYGDRFSLEKLKKVLSSIYDVDKDIKMGNLDAKIALELFIARI